MTATLWSKFFWADWLSDANLRRCSPAARGLWMDMLCVAAQHEPIGFVCINGESLSPADMARIAGVSDAEACDLIAELSRNGVCSRDRKGRLYSRRMVRDAKALALARRTGRIGGRLARDRRKGIFDPSKGAGEGDLEGSLGPKSQKPESESPSAKILLARAAQAMGTTSDALLRKPKWRALPAFVAEMTAQGCDLERDVWPTVERVARRLKRPPDVPHYFRAAILEARDARLGAAAAKLATAAELADRLAVFERHGVWSSQWGPRPAVGFRDSGIGNGE